MGARKLISGEKPCSNLSAIGVTDLREYKKRFLSKSGECKTEENREGDPISEGLPPLRGHGDQGPEGELSSHLGGRPRKKKKEGALSPSLPVAQECHRGQRSGRRSTSTILLPSTPTLSPFMQRCNTPSSRYSLYLNMALNSIYYFPMIYGYPMMFE